MCAYLKHAPPTCPADSGKKNNNNRSAVGLSQTACRTAGDPFRTLNVLRLPLGEGVGRGLRPPVLALLSSRHQLLCEVRDKRPSKRMRKRAEIESHTRHRLRKERTQGEDAAPFF